MKVPRDHAQALLDKAANDFVAARATLATGKALDTVCFHAQQAAEKSLKAVLALHDVEYPWRHDLSELLELAKPRLLSLAAYEDRLSGLTPFAVEIRYDTEFEPSLEQATEALRTATEIYDLVRARVEAAGTGQPPDSAPTGVESSGSSQ